MKKFTTLFKRTAKGATQIWEIRVEKTKEGHGLMVTRYGQQGGTIREIKETISEGKNVGKKNETSPFEQACAEAESRWNKQKDRKGYGLTVEESADIRGASAMLAQVYSKHSGKVDWANAYAQPKLDGFRCLTTLTESGSVIMVSRENQEFHALSAMQGAIAELLGSKKIKEIVRHAGGSFTLDGELYCHGMSLNEIASACKRKSPKSNLLKYHVYDAMLTTVDFTTRYELATAFVKEDETGLLLPVSTVKVRGEQDLMHAQGEFIDSGYEGAMLRYGAAGYQAGKRSNTLLKVKTFLDDEFEVIDFKNGRGTYANCAIFVCTTTEGNTFEVTAPGTLEEKRAFLVHAKEYIGQRLTVKFQYMTKTEESVPFQPVAVAFRSMGLKVTKHKEK